MSRTLLVGLDAACWAYLEPLLEQGRMPALQGLMDGGSWGTLMSTLPASTPVAWASIITGKNPGKHGVFDMMWRRPGEYALNMTHGGIRQGTPFWHRLNQAGIKTGLVNIPFTHPARPLDGFMLCGFGASGATEGLTYPASALGLIEAELGPYEPVVNPATFRRGTPEELLAAEIAHQSQLVDAALLLARHHGVDVLAINLMLPDHANHKMPDMAQVEEALVQSDRDVARLIEGFQPDNILLISDHGSRRIKGDFLLSAWLRDKGYTTWQPRSAAERSSALNWVLAERMKAWPRWLEKAARPVLRSLIPALPGPADRPFWNWLEEQVPQARHHALAGGRLDYAKSQVFFGNRASGVLYFNQTGRETSGRVTSGQADILAAELAEALLKIEEPGDGGRLISGVHTPAELYQGPAAGDAPDLIIDAYEADWNLSTPYRRQSKAESSTGPYFVPSRGNYGWHSRDGIFAFCGSAFKKEPQKVAASVMDVPATLLQIYGLPIPEDLDGRPLMETFSAEQLASAPVTFGPGDEVRPAVAEATLDADQEEQIINHLRALGYVD